MGYLHIPNLYRAQEILLFKECYALEKIHGTSAHVGARDGKLILFSGGEKHANFAALFDQAALLERLSAISPDIVVYGEAYGGKQQGQSWRYGKQLKFTAFDVCIDRCWLSVPDAEQIVRALGLEFVHYDRIPTDLAALDAVRDAASVQAARNGVTAPCPREGVVLRPLVELTRNNGERVISKHKRDEERETATPRPVVDPARLEVLTKADAIALEWATATRLEHVIGRVFVGGAEPRLERMPEVLKAMVEDVEREAAGEIVAGKEARQAISRRTAALFKQRLRDSLKAAR